MRTNGNLLFFIYFCEGRIFVRITKFGYDAFGNVRSSQGVGADTTGGDFRFQGQWLESATGLYNFRARDYDTKTGTFLSRDPVDPNEQQPESLNPYQFAYGNPYIYSDPTGMFTLIEINASMTMQQALDKSRVLAGRTAVQYVKDKAGEALGNAIWNVFSSWLPVNGDIAAPTQVIQNILRSGVPDPEKFAGVAFELGIKGLACEMFPSDWKQKIWFEPDVTTAGHATARTGYRCPIIYQDIDPLDKRPDFIATEGKPKRANDTDKSYLIGDIKLSLRGCLKSFAGSNFMPVV